MWALYAITASVLWGVNDALTEKALEHVRFSTLLGINFFFGFLTMLGITLLSGSYRADVAALLLSKKALILVGAIVLAFNIASAFIVISIGDKNATLSGLIEISYPLFIILFSWLFFRENNLNTGVILGGLMILIGVMLIYLFNK